MDRTRPLDVYRSIVEHITDSILVFDAGNRCILCNPAASVFLGLEEEQLLGKSLRSLFERNTYRRIIRRFRDRSPSSFMLDGRTYADQRAVIKSMPYRSEIHGRGRILILSYQYRFWKTEEAAKHKVRKLTRIMNRDHLTKLYNRRGIFEQFRHNLKIILRLKKEVHVGVCLIDLDFFKKVNDAFGHDKGDQALKFAARTLKKISKRSSDINGRWGGEEFVLIMMDQGENQMVRLLEKLRQTVQKKSEPELGIPLTFSAGLACGVYYNNMDLQDFFESLLGRADEKLYRAKAEGRNCLKY